MSETTTPVATSAEATVTSGPPIVPVTLASGSGPAIGATPPEAGADGTTSPAASSESEPSILSTATGEQPVDPEAPAEPEAKPEVAAEAAPAEPAPPPTYETFKLPDGVEVDATKLGDFTGMLGEFEAKIAADPTQAHAAFQELGQRLVDLHSAQISAQTTAQTQRQIEAWNERKESWKAEFRADPEIGKNRQQTTLTRMGGLMDMYGRTAGDQRLAELKQVMTDTGAGDHPAVLRFVNWAANRLTETSRPVIPMVPRSPNPGVGKANRLYRNSIGNGAS
jgi:hypothetical protein